MAKRKKTAKSKLRSGSKKLAAWVRGQIKQNPRSKLKRVAASRYRAARTARSIVEREKSFHSGTRSRSRKTHSNPVKVAGSVVGSGTGWIKAKAVRVRKSGGKTVLDIKR